MIKSSILSNSLLVSTTLPQQRLSMTFWMMVKKELPDQVWKEASVQPADKYIFIYFYIKFRQYWFRWSFFQSYTFLIETISFMSVSFWINPEKIRRFLSFLSWSGVSISKETFRSSVSRSSYSSYGSSRN